MSDLRSPIVYWGGGRRIAPVVWKALGDVDHYIEGFFGSGGVFFHRPGDHRRRLETANDADGFLANVFRALAADPHGVARYCDVPINETDLLARHLWLVNSGKERIARLEFDPDFYDLKAAGWYIWGINSWVGSGWCSGAGPWVIEDGKVIDLRSEKRKSNGRGVNRQRPHLGWGQGTNRVSLSGEQRRENLLRYFDEVAERLRGVRVCCGDWSRVVGNGGNGIAGVYSTGIFLDPPFDGALRDKGIYRNDSPQVSMEVREWCIEHGGDAKRRIVLKGYELEHAGKMKGWKMIDCPNGKRFGIRGYVNQNKEKLWLSPHCLKP